MLTKNNASDAAVLDGGAAIVAWFKAVGVRNVFSVSGGPINAVYRACARQGLPLIHTRHEAAACFMAEAQSRVTGQAGAAVVTLGPGVTNAVTPGLVAMLAGTPVIIVGAQAGTASSERGAGMAYDVLPIMKGVTKWAARCTDPNRLQEYLDIAWRKMWAGRPGPVFIEVPTDILSAPLRCEPQTSVPPMPGRPGLDREDAEAAGALLSSSRKPLLILGDELFFDRSQRIAEVVEKHGLPFATMRLARGIVDERHPNWMGPAYAPCNETLRAAMKKADSIILLGHHFEFDLEFGDTVGKDVRIVQVCSDPELLHRNRRADVALAASPAAFIDLLAELPAMNAASDWTAGLVSEWGRERDAQLGEGDNSGIHPIAAVDAVTEAAPQNTIYVTSHGNVDFWADARLRISAPGRYLRAGQSGALGAEVPYGAGASFADPEAPVIVFVGDGGVGFHVAELDTAERYGRAFIIVVLDDEMWGAIALPQEMSFGETYEMHLPRRDWSKVAEGLGGRGYLARDAAAIQDAVRDAIASGKPAIIQVPVCSVISPYMAYIS
ncbi:thiamine pyrophosphate-binding protein [Pseudaminobacter salicylatoxidans]|uniref:thiamine pyrophosphate-binding protein n=1 Tax=Pseudaminobacter salicylatoxidans TaxID=93369 RepID=UPI00031557FF|nr:thiamine pyrophosphate-binding protein [Pseudaminobacter salicylatoxidans]